VLHGLLRTRKLYNIDREFGNLRQEFAVKVLIADDEAVCRRIVESTLTEDGYEVAIASDGLEAWAAFQNQQPPALAILDWMMPGMDGVEICRRIRQSPHTSPPYLIVLTARSDKEDVASGLNAGADDYIIKPFSRTELRARLQVGARIVELQRSLAARVTELEAALARVKRLQGLLPICSYCKKIRNDLNYWQQLENYIGEHSEAKFSHGICPECFEKFARPELEKL
jgi:phosphoserine phosphatase RsbU/P